MSLFRVELGKDGIRIDQTLDRALEQHEHHHDTENLQTVARKVHHDRVHGQLLRRCQGNLPCFLDLERIGFDGLGRRGCGLLLLLLHLLFLLTTLATSFTSHNRVHLKHPNVLISLCYW